MPKKSRTSLFDQVIQGIQNSNNISEIWIDLGTIPNGTQIWMGYATYMSDGKNFTFELRSNTAGNSGGTTGQTIIHDRVAVRDGTVVDRDYHRNGRIQTLTVLSTGVEKWWLRLVPKNASNGDAYYWIYYTTA